MAGVERVGDDAVLDDVLRLRHEERTRLFQRVHVATEADARVAAAWLHGSCARGDADALSDLDVTVVVADSAICAVAGDPSRPVDYGRVLDSPRGRWIRQIAEPLLLLEAPQNAPAGGAFLTTFFAGKTGPQQVDWEWLPRSTARVPRAAVLLFDRADIPRETGPTEDGRPGTTPDRTPYEVAAHAVPWFWATLLWNAKHAARSPGGTQMLMAGSTVRAVHDVEQFLDPGSAPLAYEPVIGRLQDRIRVLFDLIDRMERLTAIASTLCADIPSEVAPRVRQYVHLAREIMMSA
ncbi:nucleotidyltransferase domain-containing protein [Actinopolymorpha sp. B11F2]|uniref:nucleotidyltransferase domain-containing protein n=1 Tax=Actinopolymorpha sp. B11F2 TaxID=3160862 RepID=UPI0032E3D097